jgi:hypothetical protein
MNQEQLTATTDEFFNDIRQDPPVLDACGWEASWQHFRARA